MTQRDLHPATAAAEAAGPDVSTAGLRAFDAVSRWRIHLVALAVLVMASLLVFSETAAAMVHIWNTNDTFAHAFLVPPISAWLVWRRRSELAILLPTAQPLLLVPLLALLAVWVIGDLASSKVVTQFALVAFVVLLVPLVLGLQVARAITFPLVYLAFCIPVGEFMVGALMDRTADFTVAALRLTGVPVYREGLFFSIPSGNWSVIEACSGLRYLIASVMVGTLYAYLNYRSPLRRWLFVGVSIVVPLVANWIRAYMIVMLGHLSDNRIATGVDHLVYGWVFFGIVITLMFMVGSRWAEPEAEPTASPSPVPAAATLPRSSRLALTTVLAAALLLVPLATDELLSSHIRQGEPVADLSTLRGAAWSPAPGDPVWSPRFEKPSAQWHARFERAADRAGVHVLYYRQQGADRKLVSTANLLIDRNLDSDLNPVSESKATIDTTAGELRVNVTALRKRNPSGTTSHLTVLATYWVDDSFSADPFTATWRGVRSRLLGRGDDGAAVLVYALHDDEATSRKLALDAASSLMPGLGRLLTQTREKSPMRPWTFALPIP